MRWQDYLIIAVTLVTLGKGLQSADSTISRNPVEVGNVTWQRDYDRAVAAAKKSGKPIFALFQEVPG
jgi:hypothetical protein